MKPNHLTILGGGPAGLAVAYFARKHRLPFTLYEASDRIGGNAATLRRGDFLFDTGAHRFHDKDPEITQEVKQLLGDELVKVHAQSQIYFDGKMIDFPPSPFNLLKNLGLFTCLKAALELVKSRLDSTDPEANFENFALKMYGKTLADCFLLRYSEKLWGVPCRQLSPVVSGKRLKGLGLNTFFIEALFGRRAKTQHLEGSFYYPQRGYGSIVEKLAAYCGENQIRRGARITQVFHTGQRIQAIEINGRERIETEQVVNTLPLPFFLELMAPSPPQEILSAARTLRFRNLILVAIFLNKQSVNPYATVYFPNPDVPFTRIYEPRNRSRLMAPPGKTSLVAEIPCWRGDTLWKLEDAKLAGLVQAELLRIGWVNEKEIIDTCVYRMENTYPVIETGVEERRERISGYLSCFENLKISGRSGQFTYTHVHDMLRFGKDIIEDYIQPTTNF